MKPLIEIFSDGGDWLVRCGDVAIAGNPFRNELSWEERAKIINASNEKAVMEAVAERDARIKGLETELLESARLHGMGSQREAALEARIAELERVLESLVRAGNYLKETAETHVMQTYDTRGSVGRKISEWDAALADIKTVLGKGE